MTTRNYKDNFTLDGRLKVEKSKGVTPRKVAAVRDLFEAHATSGSPMATARLHEALTSSDAIFNFAHFASLNFVPNYDEAPRVWNEIAGTRTVPDFRPVTLHSLNRTWTDGNGDSGVLGESNNVAPIVPEGSAYPYAYISGEVAEGASVVKRGFKTDWTLESRVNDGIGALEILPSEMLEVSLDTEEADVFGALVNQKTAASTLDGGLVPNGQTVLPNAAFSRDAVTRAIIELSERTINGRRIRVSGGYNVVVPVGQKVFADFVLKQRLAEITDGSLSINVEGYDPLAGVKVIESEFLSGKEWYLLPAKGSTRRPVLERLSLRGFETPQLFVDNHVGQHIGQASVSPFEGSFDADVITLKLRQMGGGVLWDGGIAVVYSNGTGAA